jgi:hypothetical protein
MRRTWRSSWWIPPDGGPRPHPSRSCSPEPRQPSLRPTRRLDRCAAASALNDARAALLFRNPDTGAWTQEATAFFPHNARRVAVAVSAIVSEGGGPSRSDLHMAVVTDNGFLLTAIH